MSTSKKAVSIAKEILARLTGDDKKVKAEKIARKAITSIKSKLASLRAQEVDAEYKVEDAKEKLEDAKYPTEFIQDAAEYIRLIAVRQEQLTDAEEAYDNILENICFFEKLEDNS